MSRNLKDNKLGKGLWRRVRGRAGDVADRVTGELTAEADMREPIDFSAPSVPYYTDLADKFGLARIVLFMILFVFVVVTIISNRHLITYENMYYLAKDINAAAVTAQAEVGQYSYPVTSSKADFSIYRGGLAVVSNGEVTVLSELGKQTLSESVTYADPCVRSGDSTFLTFGRGERGFAVYNFFGRVYKEQTEYPVYEACMGGGGAFAVVTRSQAYTSEVILYKDSLEPAVNWHLNGYVTALEINFTGDTLAILSTDVAEGAFTTQIILYRMGETDDKKISLPGVVAGDMAFVSDDRLAVACRDRLLYFNTKGETVAEIPLAAEPAMCALDRGGVALLSADLGGLGKTSLTVYDRNGKKNVDVVVPVSQNGVVEMMRNGEDVYIRTADQLVRVSDGGKAVDVMAVSRNVLAMLDMGEETPLLCSPAFAQRLKLSEETSPS